MEHLAGQAQYGRIHLMMQLTSGASILRCSGHSVRRSKPRELRPPKRKGVATSLQTSRFSIRMPNLPSS